MFSPRLRSLSRAVSSGDRRAVEAFWQTLSVQGTPLIEPDESRHNHSLVTFVWQGTEETQRVAVHVAVDGSGQDEHALAHIAGSDIWYVTFRLRDDYHAAYKFVVTTSADSRQHTELPDPLNPVTFVEPRDPERPDHQEDDVDSVVALPSAPARPWARPQTGIQRGHLRRHEFRSEILQNERRIWAYTPPDYTPSGAPYPLLIILDGRFFAFAIDVPRILDYLLEERQIGPIVAMMVDNPGDTWEQSMAIRERELSCHPPFSDFLALELIPWLRSEYHVTSDPGKRAIAGGSSGALAAAFSALQHPRRLGNVLALSGSFWWKPDGDVEWEWLTRRVALGPLLDVRFYVEVGLLESTPSATGFPGQLLSNRHLRDVLQAKGYIIHYEERMHGHDPFPWQSAFASGLAALFGEQIR